MDPASIDLILTALAAAGAAGLTTGVQDVAGEAVKGTYQALTAGVSRLLRRGSSIEEEVERDGELGPEELLAAFQAEPGCWEDELRRRLADAAEPDTELYELATLTITAGSPLNSNMTVIRNSNGLQVNNKSYRPKQTNYFGPVCTKVEDDQLRLSDP